MILLDNNTNLLPLLIKAAKSQGYVLIPSINASGTQADVLTVPWFSDHRATPELLEALLVVIKDQCFGYTLQDPERLENNRVRQVIRLKSSNDFKTVVVNFPSHL